MRAEIRKKQECNLKYFIKSTLDFIQRLKGKSIRILKCILGVREKLTYEERVSWFFINYYETGLEFDGLLRSLKSDDLDNFEWYNEKLKFPKYLDEV